MLIINQVIKFFNVLISVGLALLPIKVNSLECMSMNNQKCMIRPKIMDLNLMNQYFFFILLK